MLGGVKAQRFLLQLLGLLMEHLNKTLDAR